MSELTAEQQEIMLREAEQASIENRLPDPAKWLGTMQAAATQSEYNGVVNGPPSANGRRVLTAADLCSVAVRKFRWFTVPGTDLEVCIHPLSGYDMELMAVWAVGSEWTPAPGEDKTHLRAKQSALALHTLTLQVILCCYRDEEKRDRCFGLEDAPAISKWLPDMARREICQISQDLAAGTDLSREAIRSFFTEALECLNSWSSAFATSKDCPPGLKEDTEALSGRLKAAL